MNLQFKFDPSASSNDRQQVLSKLTADGAEVEQIFPDEVDEELASLYTVRVVDDSRFSTLLRRLKRSRKVAYAEAEAERAQHLPQEMTARLAARRR
jgi:hypothetical protein